MKFKEAPFKVAVSAAVALVAPLLTGANCTVEAPAGTVALAGTTTAALLLLKAIGVAAVAAALRETVQVVDDAPAIEVGVQAKELRVGLAAGDTMMLKVLVTPARAAVRVTVAVEVPPLTTANGAEEAPAGTVTLAGMATPALLLVKAIGVAAVAGALRETVQAVAEMPAREVGVQASELRVDWTPAGSAIEPPVAVKESAAPAGVAAI